MLSPSEPWLVLALLVLSRLLVLLGSLWPLLLGLALITLLNAVGPA
jgi:hypothetical protein